jgi:UDP-glucose 4-epimerase
MHVLVTGGAGFIGSHVVDCLLRHPDCRVTVFDNLRHGAIKNIAQSLTGEGRCVFVEGDICDPAAVARAMSGVDAVIHLAAQATVMDAVRDPAGTFAANVAGTENVLQAACQPPARRVIFTSSREVYGEAARIPVPETAPLNPKNTYGTTKFEAEKICRQYRQCGLPVSTFRLANVYGTRDYDRVVALFVGKALRGEPLTIYGGEQILDMVWVEDVARVLVDATLRPDWIGEPLNVGSGVGISIRALADRVLSLVASASRLEVIPARAAEVTRFVADLSTVRRYFDWPVTTAPLPHLPDVVQWMRTELL